jgi:hypothetical protein
MGCRNPLCRGIRDVRRELRSVGLIAGLVLIVMVLSPAAALAVTNPTLAGFYGDSTTMPGTTAVAVSGHYAYTTGYYAGELTAIDISNPGNPVVAGSSVARNSVLDATTVNISGGYAYVVSKNRNGTKASGSNDDGTGNSLTIFDIASNPAQPAYVGSVTDANNLFGAYGVAVSGKYAYVAAQGCLSGQPCPNPTVGNSFVVIDISAPGTPRIVATINNSSLPAPWTGSGALAHATAVAISGHYAYVTAAYSNRLTVIDISNPLAPSIVASKEDDTNLLFPVDVAVSGSYAYVVDQISTGRLTVMDISDPLNPTLAGTVTSTWLNGAYRIRLRGSLAYVAANSAGALATVDISNPLSPRLAAGFYDGAHLNKTTGLDVDPTGRYVIASSPYLSSQAQPTYPPYALQSGGPTLTGTVSVVTMDPAAIAVSIAASSKPPSSTAQTSANFSLATNDSVATLQCQIDGGPFTLCTSATNEQLTSLGAGSHKFVVQATDSAGNVASASYSWSITPPANTAIPAISGAAVTGQVLTASSGTWTGSPTFAYQWSQCDVNGQNCNQIAGATNPTYTIPAGAAGSTLEVTVTGMTSAGSASASSAATGTVQAAPSAPVNLAVPVVSGSAVVGQVLTASNGSWSGSPAPSFGYQWSQCDVNGQNCGQISGATGSTYTVRSGDLGFTLVVAVTATNSVGSASASSAATGTVQAAPSAPVNLAVPVVSGSAVEGQVLTASNGSWSGSPAPSFGYQWQRCNQSGQSCSAISGATSQTYTALAADVGSTLDVAVTAKNSVGSAQASSAVGALVTSAVGPVTSLLDNFNRADNSGPPSSNWTHMIVSSSAASNNLLISAQQITGTSGSNADYWNPQTYGPNSEVWITVATKPSADLDPVVLGLRFQNPALSTASGYQAYYVYRSSGQDQYKIIARVNGTTSNTLATVTGPTLNAGDELLFRANGTTLELWRENAGTWTRILTTTDSTFTSAGYLMVSTRNTVVRLDNFGGGTLP